MTSGGTARSSASSAASSSQVPVGLFGLARNSIRVCGPTAAERRGVVAERLRVARWPCRRDPWRRAGCLHGARVHGEGVLRIHCLDAGREERLGQQHQHVVRTVAERHLVDVDAVPVREPRAQVVPAAVGIQPDIRGGGRERRPSARPRAQRILVRRQLDAVLDAELALERLGRLARHVRRRGRARQVPPVPRTGSQCPPRPPARSARPGSTRSARRARQAPCRRCRSACRRPRPSTC